VKELSLYSKLTFFRGNPKTQRIKLPKGLRLEGYDNQLLEICGLFESKAADNNDLFLSVRWQKEGVHVDRFCLLWKVAEKSIRFFLSFNPHLQEIANKYINKMEAEEDNSTNES